MYALNKILCCLNIAIQEFTWQNNLIFKQSAAPTLATLATLAGTANGLRPLAARGLAGMNNLRNVSWNSAFVLVARSVDQDIGN